VGHGHAAFSGLTFAHLLGEQIPDAATKEKAVWIDIDNAFSRPITLSDDTPDYVPTQILAELFKGKYDGVVYRSQFGEAGYNIALFDPKDADAINCAPYVVTGVDVQYKENGNRWHKA
jgi:hypothetical protein